MNANIMWIVFIALMGLSLFVSWRLNRKIKKYSQEMIPSGLTGKEIAEKMLRSFGITDVKVQSVAGKLTDHYNPVDKTLNLSETTYNMNTIAAAAVAAHACSWLQMAEDAFRHGSFRTVRFQLVPMDSARRHVAVGNFVIGEFRCNSSGNRYYPIFFDDYILICDFTC